MASIRAEMISGTAVRIMSFRVIASGFIVLTYRHFLLENGFRQLYSVPILSPKDTYYAGWLVCA